MKEIYLAYAQLAPCSDANPHGSALAIFYTISDGSVTITSETGHPMRGVGGKPISKQLAPGEDARKVAITIGLRHWRSNAEDDATDGFNREISSREYDRRGWKVPC